MTTTIDQALRSPNVHAFLRAIRLGEGTLPAPWGLGQRALQGPRAKAVVHRRLRDAESLCPCRGRQRLTSEVNQACRRAIVVLLLPRRPSAILGRIVGVVVDPIEREPGSRISHVGVERARIAPPLAHANSASAVPMKAKTVRVVAAADHSDPSLIPACAAVDGSAVLRHSHPRALPAKTPTGSNESGGKVLVRDHSFGTALARATPPRFPVACAIEGCRREAAESLPGQIVEVVSPHGYQFLLSESIK